MARLRDEDNLEPILPKHPPTARDVALPSDVEVDVMPEGPPSPRPSWDRLVLVGCAVVATLALVVVALRTNSIAQDQRVQTCQIRVYAAQMSDASFGTRDTERRQARELAECVGIEPEGGEERD